MLNKINEVDKTSIGNKINLLFKTNKRYISVSILVALVVSLIVFAFATFYDLQISNKAYYLMKFNTTKVSVCLGESFGSLIPFWSGYFVLVTMIEIRFSKIIVKNSQKKFKQWLIRNRTWLLWTIHLFLICLVIFYFFYWFMNYGIDTFDIRLVYPNHKIRMTCDLFSFFIALSIMLLVLTYFRFFYKNNPRVLGTNIEVQGFKITAFFVLSYCSIWFFKHLFGRPFYFSVIFSNSDIKGQPWTIIDLIKSEYGITPDSGKYNPDIWSHAKYFPWYIPNHVGLNIKYWFNLQISGDFFYRKDFNKDSWWNNDFPSGHVTAYSIMFALNAFIRDIEIKKDKNDRIKKGIYFVTYSLVIMIAAQMVVYGFHWTTDVTFSMFSNVLFWVICSAVVDKIAHKKSLNEKNVSNSSL